MVSVAKPTACVRPAPGDPTAIDTPEEIEEALAPFFEVFDHLVFDHKARLAEHTQISPAGDAAWKVVQILVDPEDENLWCVEGRVDLSDDANVEGPLVVVTRIGT